MHARTSDRWAAVGIVVFAIFIAAMLVSIAMEASTCWSNDGAVAQGLSWNGIVCVDKNE